MFAETHGPEALQSLPKGSKEQQRHGRQSESSFLQSLLKLGPPAHGSERGESGWAQEGHEFEGRAKRDSTGPAHLALGPL